MQIKKYKGITIRVVGFLIMPALWILLKYCFEVSNRYLPAINDVFRAFEVINPSIWIHFIWSFGRLIIGFLGGCIIGVSLGMAMFKSQTILSLVYPAIQSLRSVPAAATVPFFLLWFGFEERGKLLLIFFGIAFNLAVATIEILKKIPDKYLVFFRSIGASPQRYVRVFALPFVLEKLLPTLRFSLSTAIGLVVISEFLGSQIGLGYLIQTARATFSMNVIFACTILFGVMNFIADRLLITIWRKLIYWKI